ncbi:hypothetical protein [Flammeovirga sp. EKP202]|uniref:hypothetical protein n=1 Tax=Flammeovirga sp. EKP202 TaxID=2770592 RepID=UPI00165F1FBF|nr:hypothetical protein [Flammeovirga sp. EKP202]MBD0399991.1 hypothetical protein [Flammeovirga sp. EKP202]
MRSILFYCSFLLFAMMSCGIQHEDDIISQDCTEGCTVIRGKLLTDNGTLPVGDVDLTLKFESTYLFGGGGVERIKAQTTTDLDGNFYIKFKLRDDERNPNAKFNIYYDVSKDEFLEIGDNDFKIPLSLLFLDDEREVNFNTFRKAYLNVTLPNHDEIKENDISHLSIKLLLDENYETSRFAMQKNFGSEASSTQLIPVGGNHPMALTYVYSRKSDSIYYQVVDTVTVDVGSTLDYTIDLSQKVSE